MITKTNSKEAIKTRMLRLALSYWNIKNVDELDPLVKLLMEALASELHDLSNELKTSEGRIIERMAELMSPGLLTSPVPAHAIMHALPGEASEDVGFRDQFYVEKKIASKIDGPLDTSVDLYFTPVDTARIFNANIEYLFTGTSLFQFDTANNKFLVANATSRDYSQGCSIYLGIKANNNIKNLNGLRFFFDFKTVAITVGDVVFQSLPLTKWSINGKAIEKIKVASRQLGKTKDTLVQDDYLTSIQVNINTVYDEKFVVIDDAAVDIDSLALLAPKVLQDTLSPNVIENFDKKLLWVKVDFPINIQPELLNELHVTLNAFPVMNARLNELRYRLRTGRNIIPIPNVFMERFLSIRSLTDGKRQYKSIPFKNAEDDSVGTYTLRTGGLERFDNRNGREVIHYLVELLRSESAAFSAFGQDFIASTLSEMNKYIALLEQKTNATIDGSIEIPSYILVKPIDDNDVMFIDYWTTNAELANSIRSGTRMQQSDGVSLQAESLFLVSQTMGGKNKLKADEKLYAFKYGLTARDRIVTVEDIKNFCFFELGSRLANVEVKRGYEVSHNPKEGLKRTIDVVLQPTPAMQSKNEEWSLVCDQLKAKLKAHSSMTANYRVIH